MTDTQIIIDEIDVTSCIYACRKLNKDGLHDCRIPNTAPFCCENIHNCYYKKLKAKEQECEELKIYIESNEQQVKEVETLVMDNDRLINELDQLKTALTEIKEIAEICKCHNADGCYECKYFNDCEVEDEEIPTRDVCKLILQKISEVEDEKV